MKKERARGADGQKKNAYKILVRNPAGRNHLEEVVVDGRIILRWFLNKGV
jgi:hypothetical protein